MAGGFSQQNLFRMSQHIRCADMADPGLADRKKRRNSDLKVNELNLRPITSGDFYVIRLFY